MYSPTKLESFNENVSSKYHIYNSVFITLPFDAINNTGALLPLFSDVCEKGFKNNESPIEIVDHFFNDFVSTASESEKIDLLFRFIQYVERQIVLFDAIEDASFSTINNLEGSGSLREIQEKIVSKNNANEVALFLETFTIRTVLTAHPTQFYPGAVLGIITDLTKAVGKNDLSTIKDLLSQLGKTPFIKRDKTTPLDEAISLIWYLENVFYQSVGNIASYIRKNINSQKATSNPIIALGFWPGGDRDGNPFVNSKITLEVATRLRNAILRCYYEEIKVIKRKLTFANVVHLVVDLEQQLYKSLFHSKETLFITIDEFTDKLLVIKNNLIIHNNSLYLNEIQSLLDKVTLFGFYFATIDIRQNSQIHDKVIQDILNFYIEKEALVKNQDRPNNPEKLEILATLKTKLNTDDFNEPLTIATIESIYAIKTIQQKNGELSANRYIISNNESSFHVLETLALIKLCDWKNPTIDIVPLFEIISDLEKAAQIMEELYTDNLYATHLKNRGNKQTVMLGFSDGTKDGGYLMANWSIYKAKQQITEVSRKYGIKIVFFDGRGGPPARGGGKTHNFYASLGPTIENQEIQLTVQGQTISSNFGTLDSCRFNIENLISAGISNGVFNKNENILSDNEKIIIETLSQIGYQKYSDFKNHPKFLPYLQKMSTLKYFVKANIGSRPAKRNKGDELHFEDLRAIPFVSSWSQLKQNVPGFFGVGTALHQLETENKWHEVQNLYTNSLFFKTLLENSMMSLKKSFFSLTSYMQKDMEFGDFWQIIYDEFLLTKKMLLKIANFEELMENYPDGKASIEMREKIVLPLLTIQQYALIKIKQLQNDENLNKNLLAIYEKIVIRSLFGNTNASRNSA